MTNYDPCNDVRKAIVAALFESAWQETAYEEYGIDAEDAQNARFFRMSMRKLMYALTSLVGADEAAVVMADAQRAAGRRLYGD